MRTPASRVAIGSTGPDDGGVIGAALLIDIGPTDALLDILMIAPQRQRRGVATALAHSALAHLAATGRARLISRWHLASEPSGAWHRRLGFVEEPDLSNAHLYLRAAEQELRRMDTRGETDESRRSQLREREQHWRTEVARLEALLDAGDDAGAFAFRRFAV